MIIELTPEQKEIIIHTATRAPQGHYCGDGHELWGLAVMGLMERIGRKPFVPDPYWRLTEEGLKVFDTINPEPSAERAIYVDKAEYYFLLLSAKVKALEEDVYQLKAAIGIGPVKIPTEEEVKKYGPEVRRRDYRTNRTDHG